MTKSTASALLLKAEEFMSQYPPQVSLARQCYEKAVQQEPNSPDILDAAGAFFAEYDDETQAIQVLRRSADLSPNVNARKYFYLGQLTHGMDAVNWFKKGIQVSETEEDSIKPAVVSALCSIGELYMTELCDEPEAEEASESALRQAVATDPNSLEALAGLANFCRVVGELEEAKRLCSQAVENCKGEGREHRMDDEDSDSVSVSSELLAAEAFPVRLNLAKTMIDLQMVPEALAVLHSLLDEDEEDVEVGYIVACAHMVAGDSSSAMDSLQEAKGICKKDSQERRVWGQALNDLEQAIKQKK